MDIGKVQQRELVEEMLAPLEVRFAETETVVAFGDLLLTGRES